MKYRTRRYFSESAKALMWDRWQKGESLNSIGRHFGCGHSTIQEPAYSALRCRQIYSLELSLVPQFCVEIGRIRLVIAIRFR